MREDKSSCRDGEELSLSALQAEWAAVRAATYAVPLYEANDLTDIPCGLPFGEPSSDRLHVFDTDQRPSFGSDMLCGCALELLCGRADADEGQVRPGYVVVNVSRSRFAHRRLDQPNP